MGFLKSHLQNDTCCAIRGKKTPGRRRGGIKEKDRGRGGGKRSKGRGINSIGSMDGKESHKRKCEQ